MPFSAPASVIAPDGAVGKLAASFYFVHLYFHAFGVFLHLSL